MAEMYERVLLSIAYHPPIQYFSKLKRYPTIYLEQCETYQKQSYRNRCHILSANGLLALTIPVVHTGRKMLIRDVRIDSSKRWKSIHLKAIESAYRSAPFYLYYIDDFINVYHKHFEFLWDLNLAFIETSLQLLNIDCNIEFTPAFHEVPPPFDDFSQQIHPKTKYSKTDESFIPRPYYQVFENKFGFVPNLSILDLIFNLGPDSVLWL